MKKLFFLLILLLILPSCSNLSPLTSIENNSDILEKLSCTYGPFDMSVDSSGNIYLSDKDAIRVIDDKGVKKSSITSTLDFCKTICIDNDRIFAFDDFSKVLYIYDLKGNMIKKYPVDLTYVLKMGIVGENVLFLHSDGVDSENRNLTAYNMETGSFEDINIPNICSFSKYSNTEIIIGVNNPENSQQSLEIYDFTQKQVSATLNSSVPLHTTDIFYSKEDGCLYYITLASLKRLDLNNNSYEILFNYSEISSGKLPNYSRIYVNNSMCWLLDQSGKFIYKADISKLSSEKKITIFTFLSGQESSAEVESTVKLFKNKHPDISVIYKVITPDKYSEYLKKKLMSGDTEIDLFLLPGSQASEYLKANVMADLNNYPSINEVLKEMIHGIKEIYTYRQKLFGIPVMDISSNLWNVNDNLLNSLGLELPKETWNWDDFYSYAKKAAKALENNGAKDTFIFNSQKIPFCTQMLDTYDILKTDAVSGKINIENNDYIHLLELCRKMFDEGLINETESGNINERTEDMLFGISSYSLYDTAEAGHLIYPPVFNTERAYTVDSTLYCMNKNSRNQELSSEYLATLLSKDVQFNFGMPRAFYEDFSLYENLRINPLSGLSFKPDKNSFNTYKTIVEYGKQKWETDYSAYRYRVLEDYFNGKLTAPDAVEMIKDKLQSK